ncbi:MAG: caspase family protein [Alphaproteobacteria bacterium]|nr:caspase family protein [Alphaproteobacteria bacterium]
MRPISRRIFEFLCLFTVLMISITDAAEAQLRFALVIGNSDYATIGVLPNPKNDARAMAGVLEELGFTVFLKENTTEKELRSSVWRFTAEVPKGSIGLFFFAGHAIQYEGRNYLLPIDISWGDVEQIGSHSLAADEVVTLFHAAGIGFGIFILDACRNNPISEENDEFGKGLAFMEGVKGETIIGFATQAGHFASDGVGPNSPYTGALISALEVPGLEIYDVFRNVRRSVRKWTNGAQRPYISASIERKFVFRPKPESPLPLVERSDTTLETEDILAIVADIWWNSILESQRIGDFELFVQHFPESIYTANALQRSQELRLTRGASPGLNYAAFEVPEEKRVTDGISSIISRCDIVAADPDDPRRVGRGVPWGLVNVREGIRECAAAVAEYPQNPRLLFQFGRLMDITGQYPLAETIYRVAARQEYSAALVNLGFMYVSGKGRDRDYGEAYKLYWQAAQLGNLRARTNIGEMFQLGWGVDKSLNEAIIWYHLAADNGWPNALDTLANLYRRGQSNQGEGVPRDLDEAVRLYKIAAELNNTNSMNNLGTLYLGSEAGEPDYDQALQWLSKATNRGNRFAPFQLGRMYRDSNGVAQDFGKALELFELSADLGFAPARIATGRMFVNGQGVAKDLQEAAFNFIVAAETADRKRPKQREEAESRLEKIKKKLTPAQLDNARKRAAVWLRGNG